MPAAKYAFAFASVILFGSAIATYFRPYDDASSIGVPVFFAVLGLIAAVLAVSADRLLKRQSTSFHGDDVGDIAVPSRSSNQQGADIDCDD